MPLKQSLVYTELHKTTKSSIVAYSANEFSNPWDMSKSLKRVGRKWAELTDDLVHTTHPVPGMECTLGLLNPLTGSLEWMSVDCYKQYSISTLVCQKNDTEETNVVNLLYVDLTSYIEFNEGSFKDSRLLHSCPDQVYILFCSLAGFSLNQIKARKHNEHAVPDHQTDRFVILAIFTSKFLF